MVSAGFSFLFPSVFFSFNTHDDIHAGLRHGPTRPGAPTPPVYDVVRGLSRCVAVDEGRRTQDEGEGKGNKKGKEALGETRVAQIRINRINRTEPNIGRICPARLKR